MPRAAAQKPYTTFVQGLITEASELTYPENASKDEDNCVLFRTGKRRRRLGIDYEGGFTKSDAVTETVLVDAAINEFTWKAVGGQGSLNFLVQQVGSTLHFYDLSFDPLSGGKKSFTVDLTTFAAAGATEIGTETVDMSSGNGVLFVVGSKIEPFYVEYDSTGDSITTQQITIEIRDFEGLDDGLKPDEEPASLSDNHNYNLKNQGWLSPGDGVTDPITAFYNGSGSTLYPGNNKQWWLGKDSNDDFSYSQLKKLFVGNTLSPRGHYIVQAFYKDRSDVSGIAGIPVESNTLRPSTTAFFSGRVWYAGADSNIYYSQILEDLGKAGKCYQDADPTSEDISDLVDTDGGVVKIPEIGTAVALFAMEEGLVILASNGIWFISGTDGGFKATDFAQSKLSSVDCINRLSLVDVEGFPVWWSEQGIYTLSAEEVSQKLKAQSITQPTIQTFYNDIPSLAKKYAKVVYDPAVKVIRWLFNSTQNNEDYRFRYDRILNFDVTLQAFYPWTVAELASDTPYLSGVFNTSTLNEVTQAQQVLDSAGDNVVNSGLDTVVANITATQGSSTFVKYLVFAPETATTSKYTFANFSNDEFVDWEAEDSTGVSYSSYLDTGYEILEDIARYKQASYVLVFFKSVTNGGCKLQVRWEWTDSGNSGKWSVPQQVYRDRSYPADTSSYTVKVAKVKVRGKGRAMQFRFDSEEGKDFELLGWHVDVSANTKV